MHVLQYMPLYGHSLATLQWGAVIGASLVAAYVDVRHGRIPNWLTGPTLGLGLLWALLWAGLGGLLESAVACILVAAPYVVLWATGKGGAGDAKLMGAIGAWLGLAYGIMALLGVLVAGALLGIIYALFRKRLVQVLTNLRDMTFLTLMEARRGQLFRSSPVPGAEGLGMPYGVCICCGVMASAAGALLWHAQL